MANAPHATPELEATVLIVDDTPENLLLLGELLRPSYRVLVANSGPVALRLASQTPKPDLILLDVMMPAMDGYAVFAHLRSDPATSDIRVIFITALDDPHDEEHGLAIGASDYITKPLRPAVVRARVRSQIELKRAHDRLRSHNANLEAEIERRMEENLVAQDIGIHALARLAETRDPETGNHLRRTQRYVRVLAVTLREHPRFSHFLNDDNILLLPKSAPLHDIGKVGIPDSILLKPGPLTAREWSIMKTHAKLGSDAIESAERDVEKPVGFLVLAKEIARYHHERWDGSGYPDGLAGEDIPISARLMALADVLDALTTRRAYKAPLPFPQARDMIADARGKHFDPDIVDAFTSAFDQMHAIAQRYADGQELPLAPSPLYGNPRSAKPVRWPSLRQGRRNR